MNTEPSPRPWRVHDFYNDGYPVLRDTNERQVATLDGETPDLNEANAALIVDAVNERDRLLAAMKAIEDLCEVLDRTDLWEEREEYLDDAIYYIRKEARAAIKETEQC